MRKYISQLVFLFMIFFISSPVISKTQSFYVPGICTISVDHDSASQISKTILGTDKQVIALKNTSVGSKEAFGCLIIDGAEAGLQKYFNLIKENPNRSFIAQSEIDLLEMIKKINSALSTNEGVVLFCHSQGSIFCYEIAERINNPDKLKIVEIAPANAKDTKGLVGYVKFKDDALWKIGHNPQFYSSYVDSKIDSHKLNTYLEDPRIIKILKKYYQQAISEISGRASNHISITLPVNPNSIEGRDIERLLDIANMNDRDTLEVPEITQHLETRRSVVAESALGKRITELKKVGYVWSNVTVAGKWILYRPIKGSFACNALGSHGSQNALYFGFHLGWPSGFKEDNRGIKKHHNIFRTYICRYGKRYNEIINKPLSESKCSDFVEIPFKYSDRYKDKAWKMLQDEKGDYWYAKIPSIDQCDNYGTFIDGIIYKYNKTRECLDTSIRSTFEEPEVILSLCAEVYKSN